MKNADKSSLFLRYKKRFRYKQRLWNILSITYTVILIPLLKLLDGTDYSTLWRIISNNIHSDEHRFDRLEYKAEQVNEKAA